MRSRLGGLRAILAIGILAGAAGCDTLVTDEVDWGSVEVRVRTVGGDPVPGARLHLFTGFRLMARGTTGSDGVHVFEFVPPGAYGVFAFLPDGHTWPELLLGDPPRDIVDGIGLEEGERATAEFVMLRLGEGDVRVQVSDASGAGIEGARAELVRGGQVAGADETGPDGVAVVEDLPHGVYDLRLVPPSGWTGAGGEPPATERILVEGGTVRVFGFELEPCLGSIVAHVRDRGGAPVAGALLDLYTAVERLQQVTTDASGTFRFTGVGCGAYGVRVYPPPGYTVEVGRGTSYHDGLGLDHGEEIEVVFELDRTP